MGTDSDDPRSSRWIVQGPDVSSGVLMRFVASDPTVQVVRRIADDAVVLLMTRAKADQMKTQFARDVFEIDAELDPFR